MPKKAKRRTHKVRRERKRAKLQQKNSRTSTINIINPSTLNFTQKEINELLNPVPRYFLVANFSNSFANEIDDV